MKTKNLNVAIILNGPPGSGKDTLAKILEEDWGIVKHQFKDALYAHTAKHFGIGLDEFIHFASHSVLKDSQSLSGLHGRTPREALIHVSEDIYKPREGRDYFGKVEANRLRELKGRLGSTVTVVYPDGGFPDEVIAIESELDAIIIVHLHRSGFDFSKDSRNYVHLPNNSKRITTCLHLNEGKEEEDAERLKETLIDIIKHYFQGESLV